MVNFTPRQIIAIGAAIVFGLPAIIGIIVGHFKGWFAGIVAGVLLLVVVLIIVQVVISRKQGD